VEVIVLNVFTVWLQALITRD